MSLWQYQQNLKPQPAVESKQLVAMAKSGELQPDDLVQKEGTSTWSPARKVNGLFKTDPVRKWVKPPKHVWERRALDLAEKDDFQGALKLVDQVLQKQPEHAQANALRGILSVVEGDVERGKSMIDKAHEIDPDNVTAFSGMAVIALHVDRNFDKAMGFCNECLRRHAEPDKETYLIRAYAYRGIGNMADALNDAETALKIDPSYKDGMVVKLLVLQESGDHIGCIEAGKKLLAIDPDNESGLMILTGSCFAAKKHKNAEALASRYIKKYPDPDLMYGMRALARQNQGKLEGAYSDVNVAIQLGANQDYVYALQATIAYQVGDLQQCVKSATEAIKHEYELESIHLIRGNALLNQDNLVSAEADYDTALRMNPANGFALLGKALVHFFEVFDCRSQHESEAHLNQASRYLKAARSYEPDNAQINQLAVAIQTKWNTLQQPQTVSAGGHVEHVDDPGTSFKKFALDVLKDVTVQCFSNLIMPF